MTWLSKPVYPYAPNLLVVKVRLLARRDPLLPSVLPLDVIDPTPVLVDPGNGGFYMMRLKGYDQKMKRCGAVVTLVSGGRSLYGRVIRFISYDRLHVAQIQWLPIPDYPTGTPLSLVHI